MTFKQVAYSRAELTAAVAAVMNHPEVSAAGHEPDDSGLSVVLSSKAPTDAFAHVEATSIVARTDDGAHHSVHCRRPHSQPTASAGSARPTA
ncbi:hypothetical protein [Kribbella sp. NPDC000426]|uniref:hypothetical protein n=1 Tax=Kribbella sp. NPDC000426 TaxID=3154255 RepID=UPI0033294D2B